MADIMLNLFAELYCMHPFYTCAALQNKVSDCAAVQSDPRLCCNHPGEFVILICFLFIVIN